MTCPKDANYPKNQDLKAGCQSRIMNDGSNPAITLSKVLICTRSLNHKGIHHHHAGGSCWRTWTKDELLIEAL